MYQVEAILEAIGGAGRYQKLNYILVMFGTFSAGFQLLNIVFVGKNVSHVCQQPRNLSDIFDNVDNNNFTINNSIVTFEKCNIHVEANISDVFYSSDLPCLYGYDYEDMKEGSLMSDMDIVCDKAPLRSLGQTLLILGQGIGASTLTWFSDRYGRRTILVLSHAIFLCLGVGIAFVPTYTTFLVLRVFLGICQQGIVLGTATINVEVFSVRYRRMSVTVHSVLWSATGCLIPLVAYLMRDYSWRYKQLGYCSVSIFVIVQFLFLSESLPWLITNRKVKKVERFLKKAARMEGKDEQEVIDVYRKYQERDEEERKVKKHLAEERRNKAIEEGGKLRKWKDPTKPSLLDLMKRKRLALSVFVQWFIWFTDSMTFFGLYMTADTLVGNHFINVFLLAVVEAPSGLVYLFMIDRFVVSTPSGLVYLFMIDRFGRRKTSMCLHGLAGTALLSATAIKTWAVGEWAGSALTVFTCLGMFGTAAAWGVTFLYTSELYPTNLRNFGLGTSSAFSRIGGMIAPFASLLVEYVPWGPGAIFGGCCLIASVMITLLPETMGRELPQTLDDISRWYQKGEQEADNHNEKEVVLEKTQF